MRDPLLNQVRLFLERHDLFTPQAHVLAALSGGPDSLALADLLRQLLPLGGPQITLAHLDHGIRGAEAQADAAFVAALAAEWQLPLISEQRDVPALARAWKMGLSAAARRARYAFLAATAQQLRVQAVATAHQADDQAETLLLHLLRGAGPAGLRGMLPLLPWAQWAAEALVPEPFAVAPPLIRPLLKVERAALLAYCRARGLPPRDDPGNRDRHYGRSRVRHDLLPQMIAQNPHVVAALGRTAQICADDYAYMQSQLAAIWPELAACGSDFVRLHAAIWGNLHPALQRYALRRAAADLGANEPSLAQIEAARSLPSGSQMILVDNLRLRRDQQGFSLGAVPGTLPQLAEERLELAAATTAIGGDWLLVQQTSAPAAPDRWWVQLDVASLRKPLALRRRRAGDRFRPLGGRGSRRIQDYFVDVRLAQPLRAAWPILVCGDTIIWPVGWAADSRFAAAAETTDTIWVGLVQADDA